VTIDIKRLIRLPGTLHGKTGFKVLKLSYNELESFVISNAFVFDDESHIVVRSRKFPKRIANYVFSRNGGIEDVPLVIGIYLLGNSKEVEVIRVK